MVIIITIYQTYVCKRKSLPVLGDEALKERKKERRVASYRWGAKQNHDQWSLWQPPHQLAADSCTRTNKPSDQHKGNILEQSSLAQNILLSRWPKDGHFCPRNPLALLLFLHTLVHGCRPRYHGHLWYFESNLWSFEHS